MTPADDLERRVRESAQMTRDDVFQAEPDLLDEAADELARLRAENEALREALRPFAREARWISDAPDVMNKSWANTGLSYGDWHRAAAAIRNGDKT